MSSDLYTSTIKVGSQWFGLFRLPWRQETYVEDKGKRVPFENQADAAQAASDALCNALADPTTGFVSTPLNAAKKAAEELFKK